MTATDSLSIDDLLGDEPKIEDFTAVVRELAQKPKYRAPEVAQEVLSENISIAQPIAAAAKEEKPFVPNQGIDVFGGMALPDDDYVPPTDGDEAVNTSGRNNALPQRQQEPYEIDEMTEAWCELMPEIMDDVTVEAGKFFYGKRFKPEMAYKVREMLLGKVYQGKPLDTSEVAMMKKCEEDIKAFEMGRNSFERDAHINPKFKEMQEKALKAMSAKKKKNRSPMEVIMWTMGMQMANIGRLVLLADEPTTLKK